MERGGPDALTSWGHPEVEAAMRERVRAAALNSFTISMVLIDLVALISR